MKLLKIAGILAIASSLVSTAEAATPSVSILRPLAGQKFKAGQTFTISGKCTPADEISSVKVKAAGQILVPLGTGVWKVGINIGRPGRFRITVAIKIGQKRVAIARRMVTILP